MPISDISALPRILIIDDSAINVRVASALLQEQGEILFALNGETGLRIAKEQLPALILLDVEMPNMNGYEVCAQLQACAETCHIPIIFVTAHDSQDQQEIAIKAGAVDVISKPVNPPLLRARVKTQLRLYQLTQRLRELGIQE